MTPTRAEVQTWHGFYLTNDTLRDDYTMTEQFTKQVDIVAKNDDEQQATGSVLVPFELDRQLDWLDEEGVRAMFNADPDDGVMHTVHPEGHAELTRNEVLDVPTTIDGVQFDTGEWVITRQYQDDDRWQLVKSGVLSAFSIGGEVSRAEEFASLDDLPDEVAIPSGVGRDSVSEEYWPPSKITEGSVREISDVDIGAVPSATMAAVKSVDKSVLDDADTKEDFVEIMRRRGATPDGAEALYRYVSGVTGGAGDAQNLTRGAESPVEPEIGANKMADKTNPGDQPDDATKWRQLKSWVSGSGSETDDGNETEKETMSDNDELAKRVDELEERLDKDGDTDGDTEKDDEPPEWADDLIHRVKSLEGDDDETEKGGDEDDEMPEWAKELAERVDKLSKATAESDQLGGADDEASKESKKKLLETEAKVFGR